MQPDFKNQRMRQKVTAVFDIGRTNKKFFLFDSDLKEVYREYIQFDEIVDEDDYPSDDLQAIENWTKEVFKRMMKDPKYLIESLNFSCYGATLVHIDENGKVLTPLYNYLKPLEDDLTASFLINTVQKKKSHELLGLLIWVCLIPACICTGSNTPSQPYLKN